MGPKLRLNNAAFLITLVALISGCATQKYKSENPSVVVASCIAKKWENAPTSGFTVPVSIARNDNGYFVGIQAHGLYEDILDWLIGLKLYNVWVDVTDADLGSLTEYRRWMQLSHERLDKAVEECQEKN